MFYVFDKNGICIYSCNDQPDIDDVSSREEVIVQDGVIYDINTIILSDNKITKKQKEQQVTQEIKTQNVSLDVASVLEALVDLQTQIDAINATKGV